MSKEAYLGSIHRAGQAWWVDAGYHRVWFELANDQGLANRCVEAEWRKVVYYLPLHKVT